MTPTNYETEREAVRRRIEAHHCARALTDTHCAYCDGAVDALIQAVATPPAAAQDTGLVERLERCKGFEVGFHFAARPPEWVVADINLDDEEFAAPTLREALTVLADKYADAARAAGGE